MIRIALLASAITVAFGATHMSQAAGGGRGGERPAFETLDSDGNGALSREELRAFAQAQATERFSDADADGDGLLTQEEMITAANSRHQARVEDTTSRMIERLDTNNDGAIALSEMRAAAADTDGGRNRGRLFDRIDANDDGTISAEEYADAPQRRLGQRGGFGTRAQ